MTKVSEMLASDAVRLTLKAQDKEGVIRELAEPLIAAGIIAEAEPFFEAILRRENLESTGIGLGVAIPHARTAAVQRTVLAFGRSEEGIDFNSLDGRPCHLVFLIAAPEGSKTEYIMTLARMSKLLRRDDAREALAKAATVDEVMEAIRAHE
jgi:fructose-specific phosphotransferase system IIA component